MSEFKVGDWVIYLLKDPDSEPYIRQAPHQIIGFEGDKLRLAFGSFPLSKFRKASEEEASVGYRMKKYDQDTLGDDFPIENHISPNCKAKDV
jgi:hypothetical protein